MDIYVKDVLGVIKELGLEKVDVLGYSMGSYVALSAAKENCDNFNKLILLCTNPSTIVPYEVGKEVVDSIENAEFKLIKDAGHMVAYEKTDERIVIIKDFLE